MIAYQTPPPHPTPVELTHWFQTLFLTYCRPLMKWCAITDLGNPLAYDIHHIPPYSLSRQAIISYGIDCVG